MDAPLRARIFQVRDLLALHDLSRKQPQPYVLQGWTYILISCALLLRKSEAANLMMSNISIPWDTVSGKVALGNGLPKFIHVHIRSSKTDQEGCG